MAAKAEAIKNNLKASMWHELETKGKFDKNAKLTFINDDMLILGCDIGSRSLNRMYREMKIYFPEDKDAFGKIDGAFSQEVLQGAPFPEDLIALGAGGIRRIWHDAKLRGRGYSSAEEILRYAKESVGIKDGALASKTAAKWFVEKIVELDEQLSEIETQIHQKCH